MKQIVFFIFRLRKIFSCFQTFDSCHLQPGAMNQFLFTAICVPWP